MRYYLKLLLISLITPPLGLLVLLLAPADPKGKLAYAIGRIWTWAILKVGGIRLRVQGLDRLDSSRQYIFIANHQSNLDIPVLIQGLRKFQLRWIAKKQLAYVPFFGWALWASRHILVDRSDRAGAMAGLKKAKERIAGGISVVIFPEGTRSADGQLLPFKRGGFLLAVQAKTPIVPITINGSSAILPRGDWRLRAGEVEVIVSEPIYLEQQHAKDVNILVSQVRAIIESNSRSRARPTSENSDRAQALAGQVLGVR